MDFLCEPSGKGLVMVVVEGFFYIYNRKPSLSAALFFSGGKPLKNVCTLLQEKKEAKQ